MALILEVLFIFRPMAGLVVTSQKAKKRSLENLEEIVELRTLKLEAANRKLKEIATHDPLTKLKNRLTLESDIERLIKASEQNHIPFALGVMDIDFFKRVNDTLGHPAGDYVLKELSDLMTKATRESDQLYRAGGGGIFLALKPSKA
tara:strand:- start:611 stop:1051 length:441 start_codon:yes stop_codon:yes gene_type:complete